MRMNLSLHKRRLLDHVCLKNLVRKKLTYAAIAVAATTVIAGGAAYAQQLSYGAYSCKTGADSGMKCITCSKPLVV
jgi:hypothetical protein